MIWAVIAVLIVILDQTTKFYITRNVSFENPINVINNFFYITHTTNKGAAWGILQNGRYFFIPLTIIVSIALIYFLAKSDNKILKLSLSLILGGAAGNLIDRIIKGSVVDFLDFYFGSYNFPTFNVADSFVVVGTFLLAYYMLFVYQEKKETEG